MVVSRKFCLFVSQKLPKPEEKGMPFKFHTNVSFLWFEIFLRINIFSDARANMSCYWQFFQLNNTLNLYRRFHCVLFNTHWKVSMLMERRYAFSVCPYIRNSPCTRGRLYWDVCFFMWTKNKYFCVEPFIKFIYLCTAIVTMREQFGQRLRKVLDYTKH